MNTIANIRQLLLAVTLLLIAQYSGYAQNDSLKHYLSEVAVSELPALNKTVSLSVSNLNIGELVRAVARETGVNIYIPDKLSYQVTSNFTGAQVKDIVYYLCVEYNLQLDIVGNIIRLTTPPQPVIPKPEPQVTYNEASNTISYDVKNIPLEEIAKKITTLTGVNITPSSTIRSIGCSGFGKEVSVEDALTQLGYVNGFTVQKIKDNQLVLTPVAQQVGGAPSSQEGGYGFSARDMKISTDEDGRISLDVSNADMQQLFVTIMQKIGMTYKILNPISGQVSLKFNAVNLEDCLYRIFKGTNFTYRIEGNVCFTGTRENPGLKHCKLIELEYRSAETLSKAIPKTYLNGVEWIDFIDINAVILYGDADRINELERFIKSVDKKIPLILIDVIIADISKNMNFDLMLELGVGAQPVKSTGTIHPGVDMTFSSSGINSAIEKVGLTNLGSVTPNFYAKLKAMEENGHAHIRSTPRLSTLNAREATINIGKTEYYKEEMNSFIGSLDPQLSRQTTYKPITAELSVKIRPIVSGDGSVTVLVEVSQSDFTTRIETLAPPGITSRKFVSEIQVYNNEMILLGGLEESVNSESRSGLPFIARIPVLKWFFGSTSKTKKDSQLTIFIKPTIIN